MRVSIKEFIKTGIFGKARIGISKHKILDMFGQPDSDDYLNSDKSIVLYGRYEFFFNSEGMLSAIQNDNYDIRFPENAEFSNEKFSIDPWFLRSHSIQTYKDIKQHLLKESIEYQQISYWGRFVIKANSGVVIDFSEEPEILDDRLLVGIRYFPDFDTA